MQRRYEYDTTYCNMQNIIALNTAGALGWRVVGVLFHDMDGDVHLLLEREVSDDPAPQS